MSKTAVSEYPGMSRLKELIRYQVKRIQDHYRSNVRAVESNSPFVQSIKHLPSWTTDAVELANIANSRYPYIARAMKFTTDFNRGSPKSLDLNGASDSIIYARDEYVRPYAAVDGWESLTPLKYLWLDSSGFNPFPSFSAKEFNGLAAASIDMTLMSLMYKGFKEKMRNSGLVLGEEHFVAIYLLTSALASQADMSLISSLIAHSENRYTAIKPVASPLLIDTYDSQLKRVFEYVINRIEGTRMPYIQVLQNIPCIFERNALYALKLPEHADTTQVNWAMLLTRMPIINFLLDIGGAAGRKANQGLITILKLHAKEVRLSRVPYTEMTDDTAGFFDDSMTRYERL